MSERKSINKYYPPDFDPSKVAKKNKRVRVGTAKLPVVRLMTPFSMKCTSCGEYISMSRKFNARKEVTDQTYLGVKIIRFHIKCTGCAREIIFRTDPKTSDYVVEGGAKRNYESATTTANQLKDETMEETLARLEKEEERDRAEEMKNENKRTTVEELEEKLNDIRRQQDLNEEIEEIRERNTRLESVKAGFRPEYLDGRSDGHEDSDDDLATQAFALAKVPVMAATTTTKVSTAGGVTKVIAKKKNKISKLGVRIRQ